MSYRTFIIVFFNTQPFFLLACLKSRILLLNCKWISRAWDFAAATTIWEILTGDTSVLLCGFLCENGGSGVCVLAAWQRQQHCQRARWNGACARASRCLNAHDQNRDSEKKSESNVRNLTLTFRAAASRYKH